MPPPLILDLDSIDLDAVVYDHDAIYSHMPHRFEFAMLGGICHLDREAGLSVAWRDCKVDDWWVRGHVPGRPIFPGVLQLEAAAQLTAFVTRYIDDFETFIAFGGVDHCNFRDTVIPPARLHLICKVLEDRRRRVKSYVQGLVDKRLVFEAQITGMGIPDGK